MHKTPPLIRIIHVDHTSSLAVLSPIIAWTLYLFLTVLQSPGHDSFVVVATTATVGGLLALLVRYRTIQRVFQRGDEVTGVISNVWFFRDRGRVEVIYARAGEKFICASAIQKTKRTQSFKVGTEVTLVVDPSNPKRAFIRDLYL